MFSTGCVLCLMLILRGYSIPAVHNRIIQTHGPLGKLCLGSPRSSREKACRVSSFEQTIQRPPPILSTTFLASSSLHCTFLLFSATLYSQLKTEFFKLYSDSTPEPPAHHTTTVIAPVPGLTL